MSNPNVSQVEVNGTTYDICDATARETTSLFTKDSNGNLHLAVKGSTTDAFGMDYVFNINGDIWAQPRTYDGNAYNNQNSQRIAQLGHAQGSTSEDIFGYVASGGTVMNCQGVVSGPVACGYLTVQPSAKITANATPVYLHDKFGPTIEVGCTTGETGSVHLPYIRPTDGGVVIPSTSTYSLAANTNFYIKIPGYILKSTDG